MTLFVFIIPFALLVGVLIWAGWYFAKQRREALAAVAARLGLRFDPAQDHGFDERYRFLDKLRSGSNRYAFNRLFGSYQGRTVELCDYHYETHSTDSKGRRQTHHHYFSFFILTLERSFPELEISKEGFFSKIAQAVGYDDIDFESHEFSRRFCVRSGDKKFAYDFCNARMIAYLLQNPDLCIEIENTALALYFPRRLRPDQIAPNLQRLLQLRQLMPGYLFS